jgi:hypothetical protein
MMALSASDILGLPQDTADLRSNGFCLGDPASPGVRETTFSFSVVRGR